MTQMTVLKDHQILSTRLYKEFQNAFSDAVNGDSEIHGTLENFGCGVNADKPQRIYAGGTKVSTGYDDEFHICYPNGVVIVLGDAVIEEEKHIKK